MQIRLNFKCSGDPTPIPTLIGTGLLALDVLLSEDQTMVYSAVGGSAGNVLAILAHLGWSVAPVGSLGHDAAANRIRHEFKSLHADTRFLAYDTHRPTPVVYQVPRHGDVTHKFSFTCPHCGTRRGFSMPEEDTLSDVVLQLSDAPSVFYFDRVVPWALELAEKYRSKGTIIMFEPSVVGNDVEAFQRAVNVAHILKYADDRIDDLQGFSLDSVGLEIQTRGKDGLKFRIPCSVLDSSWHELPAFTVPHLADTAGAGDWCSAGFLFALIGSLAENGGKGLMSARRVKESLRFGQILAALNCMQVGARGLARMYDRSSILTTATAIRNERAAPRIPDHFAGPCSAYFHGPVAPLNGRGFEPREPGVESEDPTPWLCCQSL